MDIDIHSETSNDIDSLNVGQQEEAIIKKLPANDPDKCSASIPSSRDDDGGSLTNLDCASSKMSHPSRTLYYPSLEKCVTLESDLQVNTLLFS